MRISAAWLLLLALGTGCYGPGFGECRVRCGPGGECPEGLECRPDLHCHAPASSATCPAPPDGPPGPDGLPGPDGPPGPDGRPGPDGPGLRDGGGPDGGTTDPRCGGPSLVADDFDDGVPSPLWEPNPSFAEDGGQLHLTAFAWVATRYRYDLRDGAVSVLVAERGAGHEPYLGVDAPRGRVGRNTLELGLVGTNLAARQALDGIWWSLAQVPASSVGPWWRIREASGTVYFETSSDGLAWSSFASEPLPFGVEHVRLVLGRDDELTGATDLDTLNGGVPSGSYCGAAQLVDDFGDGDRAPLWLNGWSGSGCSADEVDGQLVLKSDGSSCVAHAESSHLYDLRGASVALAVPELTHPATPAVGAWMCVRAVDDDEACLRVTNGSLQAVRRDGGATSTLTSVPYDPVAHRFWRLGELAGQTTFAFSSGDGIWGELIAVPAYLDLGAVAVRLRLEVGVLPGAEEVRARFDDANLAP